VLVTVSENESCEAVKVAIQGGSTVNVLVFPIPICAAHNSVCLLYTSGPKLMKSTYEVWLNSLRQKLRILKASQTQLLKPQPTSSQLIN